MTESGFGEPEDDGKHNPDDNVMVGRALFLFGPNNFLRRTFAKVRSLVLGAGYREGGVSGRPNILMRTTHSTDSASGQGATVTARKQQG